MKLLGIEFREFACFTRQWLPLQPGINVLVGKNNHGKTALLRGLATLPLLPIPSSLPCKVPASQYARDQRSYFDLTVVFELDASDLDKRAPLFVPLIEDRERMLSGHPPLLKYGYRISAAHNAASFVNCILRVEDREIDVLAPTPAPANNILLRRSYRYPELNVETHQEYLRSNAMGPAGWVFSFTPDDLFSPQLPLRSVLYVDAHRTAASNMELNTVNELSSTAENLPGFLQTLQGRDPRKFSIIQDFVTSVFPEFEFINPESENNRVSIKFTLRGTDSRIPLTHCGTGVEQALSLATFVLSTAPSLVLLDEPHSFLHPTAERLLLDFIERHTEHRYVISTHSAVLINSVDPTKITHLSPPGEGYTDSRERPNSSRILFDLGYRNSDFLFYDRLVFVEGDSDKEIVPILLMASGRISRAELERTGFPTLDGVGDIQVSIQRMEKYLTAVGRIGQPRMYLLDGDQKRNETVLNKTRNPITSELVPIRFLRSAEIENYLLVPDAISEALNEESAVSDPSRRPATPEEVTKLLASSTRPKGSELLEDVYNNYGLRYNKKQSGRLIAKRITLANQPAISEIADLLRGEFREIIS